MCVCARAPACTVERCVKAVICSKETDKTKSIVCPLEISYSYWKQSETKKKNRYTRVCISLLPKIDITHYTFMIILQHAKHGLRNIETTAYFLYAVSVCSPLVYYDGLTLVSGVSLRNLLRFRWLHNA